jgi:hypothetical protein
MQLVNAIKDERAGKPSVQTTMQVRWWGGAKGAAG